MAYATYTTEAIVCGTFPRNTADASFLLFTREAGMLYADARSVRQERSRQRYALQDFSLVRVSLIKGKAGWRVGSVEPKCNFYHQAAEKIKRGYVVSVVRLIKRFVRGEEPQSELFDLIKDSLDFLSREDKTSNFVSEVLQLRALSLLGYVDQKQIPERLRECSLSEIIELEDKSNLVLIDKLYSLAVKSSHL